MPAVDRDGLLVFARLVAGRQIHDLARQRVPQVLGGLVLVDRVPQFVVVVLAP